MNIIEGSGMWSLEVAINNLELNVEPFSCWSEASDHALSVLSDFWRLLIFPMKSDGLSVTEMLRVFEECE